MSADSDPFASDRDFTRGEIRALIKLLPGKMRPRDLKSATAGLNSPDKAARSIERNLTLMRAVLRPPKDNEPNIVAAVRQYQDQRRRDEETQAEITRLLDLSPFEFDRQYKDAAKSLNVHEKTLRAEIRKQRKLRERGSNAPNTRTGSDKAVATVHPEWAPASAIHSEPVDGQQLLDELISAIERFVILAKNAALVTALWIIFTWVFEHYAETNPYLRISSPAPECGKSTLLKCIRALARSAWLVSRITASAFMRVLGRERRTLLLDEGDAFLHDNEAMRNLLDGASDPDTANSSFSVKTGDDWNQVDLNWFVPIAIASIGSLRNMQTVESRSITVSMKRGTPAELRRLLKGRRREMKAMLEPLAAKCARWAADHAGQLKDAHPILPDNLSGREQDKFEPIVAIADLIGKEAGKDARAAALQLSRKRDEGESTGVTLLADIRTMFDENKTDKLASKAISDELALLEGRPWAEYGKERKPISPNQLARLLKPFTIASHTIRLKDSTPKGYERGDFEDAWDRYLRYSKNTDGGMDADPNRHNATTQRAQGESSSFQGATDGECGASKNGTKPTPDGACGSVALSEPPRAVDEGFEL
jgi:hypothetical protein